MNKMLFCYSTLDTAIFVVVTVQEVAKHTVPFHLLVVQKEEAVWKLASVVVQKGNIDTNNRLSTRPVEFLTGTSMVG